jgi:hypothetical protein
VGGVVAQFAQKVGVGFWVGRGGLKGRTGPAMSEGRAGKPPTNAASRKDQQPREKARSDREEACCFFDGDKDASAGAKVMVDRFRLSPLFRFRLAKPSWHLVSTEPPSQRSTRYVSCAGRGNNVWNWAGVVVVVVLTDAVLGALFFDASSIAAVEAVAFWQASARSPQYMT